MCGIWILVVIAVAFLLITKKERFGGPVKNIKRLPKTTCYQICGQYYNDCMDKFWNIDANACDRRRESCISICNYNDFMRI